MVTVLDTLFFLPFMVMERSVSVNPCALEAKYWLWKIVLEKPSTQICVKIRN